MQYNNDNHSTSAIKKLRTVGEWILYLFDPTHLLAKDKKLLDIFASVLNVAVDDDDTHIKSVL